MEGQGLNEAEAYESLRRQAMAKRMSMDDMAIAIIHANELLQYASERCLAFSCRQRSSGAFVDHQ